MNKILNEEKLYITIGETLAQVRRSKKSMSQDDMAERLQLSRTSISNIERGTQKAPLSIIYRYAMALGKDIDDILPKTNDVSVDDQAKTIVLSGKTHTVANSVATFLKDIDDNR